MLSLWPTGLVFALIVPFSLAQNQTVNVLDTSFPLGANITLPYQSINVFMLPTTCGGTLSISGDSQTATFHFTGVSASIITVIGAGLTYPSIAVDGQLLSIPEIPNSNASSLNCILYTYYTSVLPYGQHTVVVGNGEPSDGDTILWLNGFGYDPGTAPTGAITGTTSSVASVPEASVTTAVPSADKPTKNKSNGPMIGGIIIALIALLAGVALGLFLWRRKARKEPVDVEDLFSLGGRPGDHDGVTPSSNEVHVVMPYHASTLAESTSMLPHSSSQVTAERPPLGDGASDPTVMTIQPISEKRPLPTALPGRTDVSQADQVSYGLSAGHNRSSVAPSDVHNTRQVSEMDIIQNLIARNLSTPALERAIELMGRGGAMAGSMPPQQRGDEEMYGGQAPPSYQPN